MTQRCSPTRSTPWAARWFTRFAATTVKARWCCTGPSVSFAGRRDPRSKATCSGSFAFVDVQAGRHTSASRALAAATVQADLADDDALRAGVLALEGMNAADLGRHVRAAELLTRSADTAARAGQPRQQSWVAGGAVEVAPARR